VTTAEAGKKIVILRHYSRVCVEIDMPAGVIKDKDPYAAGYDEIYREESDTQR